MLELYKTYRTKSGRQVRIIATDRKSDKHPIIGLIDHGKDEAIGYFRADGTNDYDHAYDIVLPNPHVSLNQVLALIQHPVSAHDLRVAVCQLEAVDVPQV